MGAQTIGEVIDQLTAIVEDSKRRRTRHGYFAATYLLVTKAVAEGIEQGRFEDNSRMERMDVIFANRYLDAYRAWQAKGTLSRSWVVAFEGVVRWEPIVLAHVLAGMNAHIGLDLGIAAAETCPGASIHRLEKDFNEINNLLSEKLEQVQVALTRVAPLMWILDKVGGRTDERIGEFSITAARKVAWASALLLAGVSPEERAGHVQRMDVLVAAIGERILRPPAKLRAASLIIRLAERGGVAEFIEAFE